MLNYIEIAGVAELADAHDSKSCEVTPRVGSTPTSGTKLAEGKLGPSSAKVLWRTKGL